MPKNLSLWNDWRFSLGFALVIISIIIGFYGKIIFFTKIYEPLGLLSGLSIYVFSWLLLFAGAFLVGWKTVRLIRGRIHHEVKKTVRGTYRHARRHARNIHKKSMRNIKKVRHTLNKRIRLPKK